MPLKTYNDLVFGLLQFFRTAQPNLDTKPGTVARDLIIEGPSAQTSRLYDELNKNSNLQSFRLSLGSDLDKLAQNFGAIRKPGAKATVPALLTFDSLEADIAVNKGDQIQAKNGSVFLITNSAVISPALATSYQATAARYRADLDYVGITDIYAVEVLLEASAAGNQGNISKYSLNSVNISGINHVINVVPAGGGRAAEDDASFRTRVLAIFNGANTGTATGYRNAVVADPSVIDAVVIGPGDDLMVRDGTQVSVADDGTRTITAEGTGGKVDVLVFGSRLQESTDSYVYRDLSNTGDPSNSKNDYVLGQILADANKTVTRKRLDNLASGILPAQPVNNLVSVAGSGSGPNFVEKSVDNLGRVSGNYELIRDTGVYSGSPWGFDRLHWISDRISNFPEDKTKSVFNGQDPLSFSDLLEIIKIQQNIVVTNENSRVSAADRSSLQLNHWPITAVTRVFNVTTGERYVVAQQNPDGTGSTNLTGRIVISGKSLPAVSDILQVDYTWVFSYDPYFDYDSLNLNYNIRTVQDSVDWGLSNQVRREQAVLASAGSFVTATVIHPVSTVLSVNVFLEESGVVSLVSGRKSVVVDQDIENVLSIKSSDSAELWNTFKNDGSFSGLTIYLPTDTVGEISDTVTIIYNTEDVYNAETTGNFSGNTISIVPSATATPGTIVECNYLSNVSTLLPSTILSSLPAIRNLNGFNTTASTGIGFQPSTFLFSGSNVVQNFRQAPSNLALTVTGNISPGTFTIMGESLALVMDYIITATSAGLEQDLSSAIRKYLGLNSKTSIPSTYSVARVVKVERVETNTSLDVLQVLQSYDLKGYSLRNNSLVKEEALTDSSLATTEFTLPATTDNLARLPEIGDRLRVRFYLLAQGDSENIYFSKSGTQYSQKRWSTIDTISISSGFSSASSSSATLTVGNLNQPATKSRYKVYYDYLGPKSNERINITFNYDRIIGDGTIAVESARPINADVLVKAATPILVNVTINIVVESEFVNSATIVKQNVANAVSAALRAQKLGTTIDASDLIQVAYTVTGVDRARILFFNEANSAGSVLSITAQKNEYIGPNTVTVVVETR